jgi:hypothetical protein
MREVEGCGEKSITTAFLAEEYKKELLSKKL